MNERILVAVDDSRESLEAARTAARLAIDLKAQVRIIVVVEEDPVAEQVERATGTNSRDRHRQAAANLLEFVRQKVCTEGVPSSQVAVSQPTGDPYRQILEEANIWPADMIVMAVADRSAVRSNYIGSVTEQVIEFAGCPVLVVPAPA